MRFNVIGYLTSGTGLGRMACDLMQALIDAGHDVAGLDIDAGERRRHREIEMAGYFRTKEQLYPDGVDVLVFPVNTLGCAARDYHAGTRQIAVPLWELPDMAQQWAEDLKQFDGVVACSDFIQQILLDHGVAGWRADHPHPIGRPTADQRAALGLPEDKVLFVFTFDPSSDVARKNPAAICAAFERAEMPAAHLVVKINTSDHRCQALDDWLAGLGKHVTIINQHQSHTDVLNLIASCDVYVSLHRAEGLGLGMLEAMLLGKPVIATGWSGNLSFMDSESACLVDYRMVPVETTTAPYTAQQIGKVSTWAEPDIEHAAWWMRCLTTNAIERAAIGEVGRQKALQHQARARKMDWVGKIPPHGKAKQWMRRLCTPRAAARLMVDGNVLRLRSGVPVALNEREEQEAQRLGLLAC